jgi:hypothetical protein
MRLKNSVLRARLIYFSSLSRRRHTAILQAKIPVELRDQLNKRLRADKLTFKDFILGAIETYLGKK